MLATAISVIETAPYVILGCVISNTLVRSIRLINISEKVNNMCDMIKQNSI
jgi:hypothetical protein